MSKRRRTRTLKREKRGGRQVDEKEGRDGIIVGEAHAAAFTKILLLWKTLE
jgi:hypothetical protein